MKTRVIAGLIFFFVLSDFLMSWAVIKEGEARLAAFTVTMGLHGLWSIRSFFSDLVTRFCFWWLRRVIPKMLASGQIRELEIKSKDEL